MSNKKPSPRTQAQTTHATPFTNGARLTCELIETVSRGFLEDNLPDVQKRIDNLNFDEQRQVRRVLHEPPAFFIEILFPFSTLVMETQRALRLRARKGRAEVPRLLRLNAARDR